MTRERPLGDGGLGLALEHSAHRLTPLPGRRARFALPLPGFVRPLGRSAGALLGLTLFRRLQGYACSARLGQSYGNGLLGRSSPVFAFADVLDFLPDEFPRRSTWAL